MSEEMAPSWRSLASSASRSIKGYIAQQRELKPGYPQSRGQLPTGAESTTSKKQSWSQWAGEKLRRGSQSEYETSGDRLSLFPGWATRRYREPPKGAEDDTPFDVDVFVSGYACKLTGVGFNTRGGRAFLRLAKGFASLPKLPVAGISKSTEDLLVGVHLPPLPDVITEESEMQALDDKLRRLESDARSIDSDFGTETQSMASSDSGPSHLRHDSRTPSSSSVAASISGNGPSQTQPSRATALLSFPTLPDVSDLHRWHANLEARLHPFWSSILSNRTVRVSVYAADPSLYDSDDRQTDESASSRSSSSPEKQPIVTREITTAVDGSFQLKLSVPWESMCVHPGALHIAFGQRDVEQELFIVAELLAPPSPGPSTPSGAYPQPRQMRSLSIPVTVSTSTSIPLTYSSVRVISDIDDTVKFSGILTGARTVFHNVFVKDLRDGVIRGMGDWYTGMWKRGVRFHYVSNGPFELLPVVNEFMQISHLPPGSIRLRSYGGRSLFNGLLSAPAMRKRAAVLDVLNHFPDARFFLVGDSGEQDLELYSEIARDRPEQILGVFIRDACVRGDTARPIEDPTGGEAFRMAMDFGTGMPGLVPAQTNGRLSQAMGRRTTARLQLSRSMSDAMPGSPPAAPKRPMRSNSGVELTRMSSSAPGDYFSSTSRTYAPISEEPLQSPTLSLAADEKPTSWPQQEFSRPPRGSQAERRDSKRPSPSPSSSLPQTPLSDVEKKRLDLQIRVWRARSEVAPHIPIRVFFEPEECVEANGILDRLQVRKQ